MAATKMMKQDELDLGLEATVSVVMEKRQGEHHATLHEAVAEATKSEMVRIAPGLACLGAEGCKRPSSKICDVYLEQTA